MMKWIPRSGTSQVHNCIWLPRMIDKARRVADGSGYLIDGEYMFGEKDFADGQLLKFLGLSSAQILDAVHAEPDDGIAAARILALSGRTPRECAGFNRRLRFTLGPFLAIIDADEGRRPVGPWASLLLGFYNAVVARIAIAIFRRNLTSPAGTQPPRERRHPVNRR